jgi:hypothetical protein
MPQGRIATTTLLAEAVTGIECISSKETRASTFADDSCLFQIKICSAARIKHFSKIFLMMPMADARGVSQGEKLRARYPQSDCCTKCRMRIYDIIFRDTRKLGFLM